MGATNSVYVTIFNEETEEVVVMKKTNNGEEYDFPCLPLPFATNAINHSDISDYLKKRFLSATQITGKYSRSARYQICEKDSLQGEIFFCYYFENITGEKLSESSKFKQIHIDKVIEDSKGNIIISKFLEYIKINGGKFLL